MKRKKYKDQGAKIFNAAKYDFFPKILIICQKLKYNQAEF
jgi:hypothetical protein